MKKRLLIAFALALMVPWAARAQNCTQTVPYTQGFEGVTGSAYNASGTLPSCWTGFRNGTDAVYLPHVVTGTGSYSYQHTGSNSLVMTSGSGDSYGNTKYVFLPPMNVPLNQLQISFWMCTESSTNGALSVGYVTSDDTSTFVPIATYPASTQTYHGSSNGLMAAGVGMEIELQLDQVPSTATRLAFKWYYNSTYYSCCVDDVVVDYIPTCPRVDNLAVLPASDEVTLSWTEMGNATNWEVVVSDTTGVVSTDIVSTNPATITGLNSNTDYTVSVRAVCGAGDTSLARTTSFHTLCPSVASEQLPYSYGFEDASGTGASATFNTCFGRHTNYSTAYPYTSSTYVHGGSYSLYFYSTANYYSYLTLPMFADDLSDLYLTF